MSRVLVVEDEAHLAEDLVCRGRRMGRQMDRDTAIESGERRDVEVVVVLVREDQRVDGRERVELEVIAGRLTAAFRMVQRARIVLYAAQGLTNVEIAARLDTAPEVVAKWRRRFRLERLEGLRDKPRAGRPRRFPPGRSGAGQGGRVRTAQPARRPDFAVLPG